MSTQRNFIKCSTCGESTRSDRTVCWLCKTPLDPASIQSRADAPTWRPYKTAESGLALVSLLVTVAVVCLGAFVLEPGVGIALAIVSIIPIVRTAVVISQRAENGAPASWLTTVCMFLGSVMVTAIILSVVVVAAVGTFFVTCLGIVRATNVGRHWQDWNLGPAMIISAAISLVVVGFICFGFAKWVRTRWRRDVGER